MNRIVVTWSHADPPPPTIFFSFLPFCLHAKFSPSTKYQYGFAVGNKVTFIATVILLPKVVGVLQLTIPAPVVFVRLPTPTLLQVNRQRQPLTSLLHVHRNSTVLAVALLVLMSDMVVHAKPFRVSLPNLSVLLHLFILSRSDRYPCKFLWQFSAPSGFDPTCLPAPNPSDMLYMGDFNTRHPDLGDMSTTPNRDGCLFTEFISTHRLTIGLLGVLLMFVVDALITQSHMA